MTSASIPSEVSKTIDRLRSEAKAKLRLADELERNYTGEEPRQFLVSTDGITLPLPRESASPLTVERLIDAVREKGGRAAHLAERLKVSESRIRELVDASGGRLYIPDWRGWVKARHK